MARDNSCGTRIAIYDVASGNYRIRSHGHDKLLCISLDVSGFHLDMIRTIALNPTGILLRDGTPTTQVDRPP